MLVPALFRKNSQYSLTGTKSEHRGALLPLAFAKKCYDVPARVPCSKGDVRKVAQFYECLQAFA